MCLLRTLPLLLLVLVLVVETTSHASLAFQPVVVSSRSTSSSSSPSSLVVLLAKKRGASNSNAKNLRQTVGGGMGSSTAGTTSRNDINWCPMPVTEKAKMPTIDNQIVLLDTELPTMKNSATNPTGAVAVTKFNGQTYCFASSCPTCQIPLSKAQILPPHVAVAASTTTGTASTTTGTVGGGGDGHARLVCDLCKSTYSLGTGLKIKDPAAGAVATGGILSSVVKSLFSANPDNAQRPLKLYKLGEKANGQLVIDVD